MHAHRAHVVLADGGKGLIAFRQDGELGAVGGVDGVEFLATDGDRLNIGHILQVKGYKPFIFMVFEPFVRVDHAVPPRG